MHEGTPIKSHIADFFTIINDLDKIEVKIEDEDQALLLLCSLPSSNKSFRKAIIYGGKSTSRSRRSRSICSIRTKLTPSRQVSLIMMIPDKFIIQGRKVIIEVPLVTQNIRI